MPKIKVFLDFTQNINILQKTLYQVATTMSYQYFPNCGLLFKFGEKGFKFYFILKGYVTILGVKEEKVYISKMEFYNYITKLMEYDERELVIKSLNINQLIFNYSIDLEGKFAFNAIKQFNNEEPVLTYDDQMNIAIKDYLDKEFGKKKRDDDEIPIIEEVTPDDYMKKFSFNFTPAKPEKEKKIIEKTEDPRKVFANFSVFTYIKIVNLIEGGKFGDVALDKTSAKRGSTVITSEDCHLGVIDKKDYEYIIKEGIQIELEQNIHTLLTFDILCELSRTSMHFYYNNFAKLNLKLGDKLVNEGDNPTNIYLIDKGEFSLNFKKSLSDIDLIIKILKPNYVYEKVEDNYDKLFQQHLHKYMHEIQNIKVAHIMPLDVVGLNDCILQGKNMFSLECTSPTGKAFELKSIFFKTLVKREMTVKEKQKNFCKLKTNKLIERLVNMRNSLISSFYDLKRVNIDILDSNKAINKLHLSSKSIDIRKIQIKIDNKFNLSNVVQKFNKRIKKLKPDYYGDEDKLPKIKKEDEDENFFLVSNKPEENIESLFKRTIQHNVNRKQTTLITQDENLFSEVNTDYESNSNNTFHNKTKSYSYRNFEATHYYNKKSVDNSTKNCELNIIDFNKCPIDFYKVPDTNMNMIKTTFSGNNSSNQMHKNNSSNLFTTINNFNKSNYNETAFSKGNNNNDRNIDKVTESDLSNLNSSIFMKSHSLAKLRVKKLFSKIPLRSLNYPSIPIHSIDTKSIVQKEKEYLKVYNKGYMTDKNINKKEISLKPKPKKNPIRRISSLNMIYDNIKLEEQKFNSTHFNNNPNYSIIIDNDLQTIKSPERKVSHLSSTKHHTFRFFKI